MSSGKLQFRPILPSGRRFVLQYREGLGEWQEFSMNEVPPNLIFDGVPDLRAIYHNQMGRDDWTRLQILMDGSMLFQSLQALITASIPAQAAYTDLRDAISTGSSSGERVLAYRAWQRVKAVLNASIDALESVDVPWDEEAQAEAQEIFLKCGVSWVDDVFEPYSPLAFSSFSDYQAARAAAEAAAQVAP